jgi:hypothetical protein
MSGAGTGLALVGAFLRAGELAAANWDPTAGFARYERRMRRYVEDSQEIGRMHVQVLTTIDPNTPPIQAQDMQTITALVERAVGGPSCPTTTAYPTPSRQPGT